MVHGEMHNDGITALSIYSVIKEQKTNIPLQKKPAETPPGRRYESESPTTTLSQTKPNPILSPKAAAASVKKSTTSSPRSSVILGLSKKKRISSPVKLVVNNA